MNTEKGLLHEFVTHAAAPVCVLVKCYSAIFSTA